MRHRPEHVSTSTARVRERCTQEQTHRWIEESYRIPESSLDMISTAFRAFDDNASKRGTPAECGCTADNFPKECDFHSDRRPCALALVVQKI